jgi:hypothetical protein
MKKILKIFKIFSILTVLTINPALASSYSDINPNSVLQTYLNHLSDKDIISGYPDGTFKPDQTINRAEALKIIFSTTSNQQLTIPNENEENNQQSTIFSDVPIGQWFTPYILSAKNQNIISGYPDGSFKPAQNVNRAEFIKMAMRALPFYDKINENKNPLKQYSDLNPEEWYMDSVGKAFTLEFLPMSSKLNLHQPMLRGDAAEIIYKISQYLEEFPEALDPEQSRSFVPPESIITIDPLNIDNSTAIPKPAITYEGIVYEQIAGAQIQLEENSGLIESKLLSGQLSLSFSDGCYVDFLRYPYDGDPQLFFEENLMIDEYSMFPTESQNWGRISEESGYDSYLHSFTYMLDEKVLAKIGLPKTGSTPYFITNTGYVLTLNGHAPGKEASECQSHVDKVIDGFSMSTL